MKELHLAFLLHGHQPWWQRKYPAVFHKIMKDCYLPLFEILLKNPQIRLTLNLTKALVDQLLEYGYTELIETIKTLVKRHQIELTGSLSEHGLFPFLTATQRDYQESEQRTMLEKIFGAQPWGFFSPEMVADDELKHFLREKGYMYVVFDDQPFIANRLWPFFNQVYSANNINLFTRSALWSNQISFHHLKAGDFIHSLIYGFKNWVQSNDVAYVIIAMDVETFGGHGPSLAPQFFEDLLKAISESVDGVDVKLRTISQLCLFPQQPIDWIPFGSWSTDQQQAAQGLNFPLWDNPYVKEHELLWQLFALANQCLNATPEQIARASTSCAWWNIACNARHLAQPQIELMLQIIEGSGDATKIEQARKLATELLGVSVHA